MEIDLQINHPFLSKLEPEPLKKAARLTLDFCQAPPNSFVSVVVTDSETVQALNRQYRGLDAPTDVLSFVAVIDPDFPSDPELTEPYLGDIVIAYPVAEAQALAANHPPSEEVVLLTVHGLLHLLGFDHDTPEHKAAMWAAQGDIMSRLDLDHVQPTEI